jgi:hypothetical protein
MDASRRQAGLVSVGGSPTGVGRLVALILVLVLVAIVKPWGSGPTELADPNTALILIPSASPTPATTPVAPDPSLGPDQIACLSGVELVSLVRLGTWNVRGWEPLHLTEASGPTDPHLSFIPLDGTVRAIGVCNEAGIGSAPAFEAASVHPVLVGAWLLPARGARSPTKVTLSELRSPEAPAGGRELPHLYQPIERGGAGLWRPGRYALEVASNYPSGSQSLWIGVDVRPTRRASG